MRLRSLEIQGFKSFPDKTRLEFNDGITAVVGPNGSGKSNIADAMRWVLGEQSTKTLRGGKMEDVIFGGTQARKAQGYAQVQLTIDNRDRALGYDNDEVSIARKLYRSGESEYRINGVNVRLKDIHELFMDTGLGRDGYSIIGQGKIAEIVSAKAAQRREIFEEAAGIAKYRYRKGEAQRRLEGAEENLLRLRDILVELEGRVEPLRIQSEKAMKFIALAEEKRTLEISLWICTLEHSKTLLREQDDQLLSSREEHDRLQAEIDEVETGINDLFVRMQELAVEIDADRAAVRELEEASAGQAAEIAVFKNDRQHNDASAERIQGELSAEGASEEELSAKLHSFEQDIAQKEQELDELRGQKADMQQQVGDLETGRAACAARIDALKERRFGLTQSVNQAKMSSASSVSLIDQTIERLGSLKENSVRGDENVMRLQTELNDCTELAESVEEKIASLENARRGHQLKLQGRQDKFNQLTERRRGLEDKVRASQQRAKLLFDMENSMEGFAGSVKYVMGQVARGALRDVHGPVSRLITVGDEHAQAIEIALGAAMQNIVVKDEAVAKRAIAMLRESKGGRATFLPVETIRGNRLNESWLPQADGFIGIAADLVKYDRQFSGIIDQLLGKIVIVRDLDCATAVAKRGSYRFRVVTLDGQVVNAGGSMTGGYAARNAGILSRSGEIDALKAQAAEYEEQIAQLDVELKALQEELSAADAKLSGIQGELLTAQEDKIRAESEHRRIKLAHEDAVRVKEQSAREYDQLTARLAELKASHVSNDELLADFDRQLEEVATLIAAQNETRDAVEQKLAKASAEIGEQNLQIVSLTREIDGIRQIAAQLADQKANHRQHEENLRRQLDELAEKNAAIEAKIAATEQARAEQVEKVQALSEGIRQKTEARNAREAEATALRAGEKEILSRREAAGRELARLEEKRNTMQAEYDGIIARLWDEYELTRTQAAELAQPVEDEGKAKRRLGELKNSIKALGSVNVAAVEEYKEVSERYIFLKTQTDDAEKSREELVRLINQLTEDMQSIFEENFKKICTNFTTIFAELFGGGKGTLTLTDPQNMLESGIEIDVQPPGKLIANLTSLSGGEQALSAIAIYFAILKVRPSPFVLLDEIEAALDDVNVVKYAQYLRTICGNTQFFTITHRRGTMEEANVLYGVTMQEEGVSKLLRLDVSELESKLGIK